MAELYLIRHAQASFGADDYDKLSELGHKQSYALGQALAAQGVRPDTWIMGDMRRHRETIEGIAKGMGLDTVNTEIHTGLNEFDFTGLLNARYRGHPAPENMHTDRKTHFRTLRETVLAWQADDIQNPPETWTEFKQRIEFARQFIMRDGVNSVLALSSGGAISQMISAALETPKVQQVRLQLQMKNCAVNRFIFTPKGFYLHGFNESPHITQETDHFLTYS
ncbi:histidine phosphatase family protein [Paracoccaceae bacterium]|jgi:broad specificity phosphatase PhoE|nr:histidine phosphatase family protein [Paracoccaceae bacterium]